MMRHIAGWLLVQLALGEVTQSQNANRTVCNHLLCTWWHDNGEVNTATMVQPGNVRQSHKYLVQVSVADANEFYDSFAYETIPRNGRGRIYSPWNPPDSNTLGDVDDGITIEISTGIDMAWSQLEYDTDIDVKILARDGSSLGTPAGVIIRPTTIPYKITSSPSDGGIVIRVPRDSNGRKFSIEFDDNLYTYRSNGTAYVASGGEVVSVEPTNGLLIFASAFISDDLIPDINGPDTTVMTPGPINQGDWGSKGVLYFPPGVYWMNSNAMGDTPRIGEDRILLNTNTFWVYFAPGAYVKGAIEYSTQATDFYATGHGVLSGEHYVYQANVESYYQANKSDTYSLRMWWHNDVAAGQTWHCHGPTINSPPFNTMDFNGDNTEITTRISDYKQVGGYYFQTDGPEMYPDSIIHDIFYHSNDDVIKVYYSGVNLTRTIVWKCLNDPIVQMGWTSRNISDVNIHKLSVIHARYLDSDMGVPTAIIGASPFYESGLSVNTSMAITRLTISDIVCEGSCPSLLRITPLQDYADFLIENVAFPDGLQTNSLGIGESFITAASEVTMGLTIANWTVAGDKVTMENFQSDSLGQLDIDISYWGEWTIE